MPIEQLANIAEVFGIILVAVTFIFLALQMRQNTAAIQANGRQATLNEDSQFLYRVAENPVLELNMYKPELTDAEKVQLHFFVSAFFRVRELNWFQYQSGVLDEATWESYRKAIGAYLRTPRWRNWWQHAAPAFYDEGFAAPVNELIADEPIVESDPAYKWIE